MNKRIFVASTLDNNIELLEAIEDKATKYSCELSYYKYEDAQDRFDKMQQDIIDCDFSIFVDLNTAVPIFNNSQSLPFIQLVEFLRTRQFKNERGDIDEKPAIFCRYLSHGYDDDFDDDLDDIDDGSEFIEEINSPEINGAQKIINTFVENQTFNINHLRFFIERAFPLCGIPIRRNKTLISCPFEIIRNQKNNYDDIVDAIDSDGACEIVKVSGIRADNGRQHTEMACRNADTYLGILTRSYGEYDDFWEKTYVQYEYDFAKTHNYPVYVLIPDGGFTFHGAKKTHPKDDFRKYRKALKNESNKATFRTDSELIEKAVDFLYTPSEQPNSKEEIPSPPQPFIRHEYTLLQKAELVGREGQIILLNDWINDKTVPLLCIDSIGGAGKTALA